MKRHYAYRDFEVAVELEAIRETSHNVTLLLPRGFIAVVHIRKSGASRPLIAPLRLLADSQQPFATEVDALIAGFSAGQRVIDDALRLEY